MIALGRDVTRYRRQALLYLVLMKLLFPQELAMRDVTAGMARAFLISAAAAALALPAAEGRSGEQQLCKRWNRWQIFPLR